MTGRIFRRVAAVSFAVCAVYAYLSQLAYERRQYSRYGPLSGREGDPR